jgi:hypothetical protein
MLGVVDHKLPDTTHCVYRLTCASRLDTLLRCRCSRQLLWVWSATNLAG